MYGHFRNSGIGRIHNYAQALKQWDETTPIRRRTTDDRPLGHRRNTWYLINKREDDAVECKMYGEPIVIFHKDDRVEIKNFRYNTISTANFIYDVLRGVNAYVFDHSLVIGVGNQEQRLQRSDSLILKRNEGWNYHFADHKPEVTHVINRENAKAIRAKHKDFMQYLDGMAKLRGVEPFTRDELTIQLGHNLYNVDFQRLRYYNPDHSDAKNVLNGVKEFAGYLADTGENKHLGYYKAMLVMVHSFGKYDWQSSGFIMNIHSILRDFDKVLMGLYRDEYLDAKLTDGSKAKRDAYGAYWGGIWGAYHKGA